MTCSFSCFSSLGGKVHVPTISTINDNEGKYDNDDDDDNDEDDDDDDDYDDDER